MIKIITVGKKHEPWIKEGVERYQKRLRAPFDINWVFPHHSAQNGQIARQEESERILKILKPTDYLILLDERGKSISSPTLAEKLNDLFVTSREVVFVIGGAYGVNNEVHARADFVWSLSDLVFPHQLVRLILTEQLYRAQEIAGNRPYHHD